MSPNRKIDDDDNMQAIMHIVPISKYLNIQYLRKVELGAIEVAPDVVSSCHPSDPDTGWLECSKLLLAFPRPVQLQTRLMLVFDDLGQLLVELLDSPLDLFPRRLVIGDRAWLDHLGQLVNYGLNVSLAASKRVLFGLKCLDRRYFRRILRGLRK